MTDGTDQGYETRLYAADGGLWVAVTPLGAGAPSPLAALVGSALGEGTALLLPTASPLRLTMDELAKLVDVTAAVLRGQLEQRRERREVRRSAREEPAAGS